MCSLSVYKCCAPVYPSSAAALQLSPTKSVSVLVLDDYAVTDGAVCFPCEFLRITAIMDLKYRKNTIFFKDIRN